MVSSDENPKRKRRISPPIIKRKKPKLQAAVSTVVIPDATPSAVESGSALVEDHLAFYSNNFSKSNRADHALLPIPSWQSLYRRNQHPSGHHFVIHQHDHPAAGLHYDLRLQINESSSCSWAIMYGLPGNPNSSHLNRNATETRVHCLWNHLIESASRSTGSLLIWDTGEYEVLSSVAQDPDLTDAESQQQQQPQASEPEKLATAFARGKIRLRLHGSRLPKGYVLYMRRPKNAHLKDRPPSRRHRRQKADQPESDEDRRGSGTDIASSGVDQDQAIRRDNAYPGARNSIGSVHQRTWYVSMDRALSGFRKITQKGQAVWVKNRQDPAGAGGDDEADDDAGDIFLVRGREIERSVVTGRLAADIMRDEGVVGYVPRPGWRPIVE